MSDAQKEVQIRLTAKDETKAAFDSASGNVKNATTSWKGMALAVAAGQAAFSAASQAVMATGRAIKNLSVDSVNTALAMERIDATLPVLAKNAGRTQEEVDGLILSIRNQNKSMQEAKEITQGVLLANLKMTDAERLLAGARDVGATVGRNSADVNRIILSAVTQLNPQMLQQLGLNVSMKIAYGEMAEELGKTVTELTTAERMQAIFNQTMIETDKFAGAYTASMGTAGKTIESAKAAFSDIKLVIGETITGAFYPLADATLQTIRSFRAWAFTSENELNPTLQRLRDFITGSVMGTFNGLTGAVGFVREAYIKLVEWLEKVGLIDKFRDSWQRVVDVYNAELKPAIDDLYKALEPYMPLLAKMAELWGTVLVGALILTLEGLTILLEIFIKVETAIVKATTAAADFFAPALGTVGAAITGVINLIQSLIDKFVAAGNAAQNAAASVRSFLGGSAQVGEQTNESYYRRNIPAMAEGGIVTKPTYALIGEAGPEAVVPLSKGGIGGINVMQGATVNVGGQADERRLARTIASEIARTLQIQRQGLATQI